MRVAEARETVSQAVTAQVQAAFAVSVHNAQQRRERYGPSYGEKMFGPCVLPPVPAVVVEIRYRPEGASVIFTWKARQDVFPYFIMNVPTYWPRRIAQPGWAVLVSLPVLDVLAWDDARRPTRVHTATIYGHWDTQWGWRAGAVDAVRQVDWTDPDNPELRQVLPTDGRLADGRPRARTV